jgi:4-hydroxy-tetrahydrodipicolinate reductase
MSHCAAFASAAGLSVSTFVASRTSFLSPSAALPWFPFVACPASVTKIHRGALLRLPARFMPSMSAAAGSDTLAVMVNGVPGKMAASTAEEVVARRLILADEALTGPAMESTSFSAGGVNVSLYAPEDHEACLKRVIKKYPHLIVVDYTHPSACNPNVELYTKLGISFVIGTTGGDVDAMHAAVERSPGVYSVIAPNMGKQIVAFQAMMSMMAREFPAAFSGYSMTVTESHQSTKADTSGTAKAVVSSFQDLGLDFDVDQIDKVRISEDSINKMGVPADFVIAGHAYHTYHLTSPDGTVNFEFQHNVCGRGVYAAGTVDAVQFLDARRTEENEKRMFNMIDILRCGALA